MSKELASEKSKVATPAIREGRSGRIRHVVDAGPSGGTCAVRGKNVDFISGVPSSLLLGSPHEAEKLGCISRSPGDHHVGLCCQHLGLNREVVGQLDDLDSRAERRFDLKGVAHVPEARSLQGADPQPLESVSDLVFAQVSTKSYQNRSCGNERPEVAGENWSKEEALFVIEAHKS